MRLSRGSRGDLLVVELDSVLLLELVVLGPDCKPVDVDGNWDDYLGGVGVGFASG